MSDKPKADLKNLERLVGEWEVSGDAQGHLSFAWAEGNFFLVQQVELQYGGRLIKGIEYIGHVEGVNEKPSKDIRSRFYSHLDGLTLDYTYELKNNTFTVWFGERDSNNYFQGTFSPDNKSYSGAWHWPGGGYSITAKRVK